MSRAPGRGSRAVNEVRQTMERRKFVIGMGALASGSAAAMGTGAFTSAQAERTIDVDVTGDESGFIGLEATSDYAELNSGQLTLNFNGDGDVGDGVNDEGIFYFEDVFKITHQGSEDGKVVRVDTQGLSHSQRVIFFKSGSFDTSNFDTFGGIEPIEGYPNTMEGYRAYDEDETADWIEDGGGESRYGLALDSGEEEYVGVYINTRDDYDEVAPYPEPIDDEGDISGNVEIVAGDWMATGSVDG